VTDLFRCRAALFDSDGVLVDSRRAAETAWSRWAERHGLDPQAVLDGMHGRRSRDTVAQHLDADAVEQATAEIDGYELDSAAQTAEIPGAAALLRSIPDPARAVVSSASRALLSARLSAAGVPLPATLISGELVGKGKPAPDPYLIAAEALRVPITECVIFEDSENGIRAGRAAGAAAVIGVGEAALGQGCDAVIPELTAARWTDEGVQLTRRLDG